MKTLTFALLLVPTFAFSVDKKLAQKKFSLDKLQDTYKKAQSLEADIVQEVYQASLARTKTSTGSLKLSKPNFIRWEIYEPEASVMVSNGSKVSYFTPDARGKGKGQVIERKAAEIERQALFRILTGKSNLKTEFDIQKTEQKEILPGQKGTELTLKPKKPMSDVALATVRVNEKHQILELLLENLNGNKTKISLQNQKLGDKLPPALFQFKAPEGTEIVRHND